MYSKVLNASLSIKPFLHPIALVVSNVEVDSFGVFTAAQVDDRFGSAFVNSESTLDMLEHDAVLAGVDADTRYIDSSGVVYVQSVPPFVEEGVLTMRLVKSSD